MRQPANSVEAAIAERLCIIQERVRECALKSGRKKEDIRVLAVTKTVPPEQVNFVLENGIEWIGENRVQEYLEKRDFYHVSDEKVHFIGHLQTNKVKYIIEKVGIIESVGSLKLAEEINRRAKESGRQMKILLEVNIAAEDSKNGFSIQEVRLEAERIAQMGYIHIQGLMCIPQIGRGDYWFAKMEELFHELRAAKISGADFVLLSMGMSADYEAAILRGANIVRIGSALFGGRVYR